jgi:CelD/BcsL family acetyltransferase involved in cellulose biosynthesis
LPTDKADLQKTLKRNLLESIHRSRNRLTRQADSWTVTVHEDVAGIEYALPVLTRLHSARSHMAERRHHPDYLSADGRKEFLSEALRGIVESGRAQIFTLDVDGTEVAAQLVLHAADSAYLGFSGVDPDWWTVGAVTLLQWHAAESAIEQGRRTFNRSVGPNLAKLRWSEQIVQHPGFAVSAPQLYYQLAFTGYRAAAAVISVRREAAYRRVGGSRPSLFRRSWGGTTMGSRATLHELKEEDYEAEIAKCVGVTGFHRWFFLNALCESKGFRMRTFAVAKDGATIGVLPIALDRRGPASVSNYLPVPHVGPLLRDEMYLPDVLAAAEPYLRRRLTAEQKWAFGPGAPVAPDQLARLGYEVRVEENFFVAAGRSPNAA